MKDVNFENTQNLMEEFGPKYTNTALTIKNLFQKKLRWKTVEFVFNVIPEPSHRPRLSGCRIYVPGAAKHQAYFHKNILPELNGLFITTPCKVDCKIFCQTPKSMSKVQKLLAEMGVIRPWGHIGDVDNYLKSYMDAIQPNEKRGHIGLMADDCLVIDSTVGKYYSITPRVEMRISFMGKLPDELAKILRITGN